MDVFLMYNMDNKNIDIYSHAHTHCTLFSHIMFIITNKIVIVGVVEKCYTQLC